MVKKLTQVIEEESTKYNLFRDYCRNVLIEITEIDKTREVEEEQTTRNLRRICEISRYTPAPYQSLVILKEAYRTTNPRKANQLIGTIDIIYRSKRANRISLEKEELEKMISELN